MLIAEEAGRRAAERAPYLGHGADARREMPGAGTGEIAGGFR